MKLSWCHCSKEWEDWKSLYWILNGMSQERFNLVTSFISPLPQLGTCSSQLGVTRTYMFRLEFLGIVLRPLGRGCYLSPVGISGAEERVLQSMQSGFEEGALTDFLWEAQWGWFGSIRRSWGLEPVAINGASLMETVTTKYVYTCVHKLGSPFFPLLLSSLFPLMISTGRI